MPFVVWRMSFARTCLVIVLLLLCAARASAQSRAASHAGIAPSRLAINGTYWFGSPLTFDRSASSLRSLGTIPGTSKDHSIGIAGEIGFTIATDWMLLFQAGYRAGNGEFVSEGSGDPLRDFTVTTDYTTVDIGLMMSYELTPWLEAIGGASLSFYPSSSAKLVRPLFNGSDSSVREATPLGKPIHVHVPLGTRLTAFESDWFSISLDLLAAINMTEAIRGYTAQSFRFGGGVSFAWNDAPKVVEIRDSIFIPVKPRLSASTHFTVNDLDADSITVITIDTVITSSTVIPQYLYFDRGSSSIDTAEGLPNMHTMLAEIGKRLNEHPTAEVTIELRRNTSESVSISAERTAAIKRLIGSDRVTFNTSGKPVSELAYAVIRTSDPLILAPMRTREVRRDQRVDQLSIERSTIAEAGVREWSITIMNESDTLIAYGNTVTKPGVDDFSFSLPSTASHLTMHSFVIDRAGQRSDSYDTLYVRSNASTSRQIAIDEYVLIGQPKPPGQDWSFDQSLIDLIVRSTTPSTVIEVSSLFPSGVDRLPEIIRVIFDACKAKGAAPRRLLAVPSHSFSHSSPKAFENSLHIKVSHP